jgi:hypothetical protein
VPPRQRAQIIKEYPYICVQRDRSELIAFDAVEPMLPAQVKP